MMTTETSAFAEREQQGRDNVLLWLALGAAMLWFGGLGSLFAVIASTAQLRAHCANRNLARIVLALGVLGLLLSMLYIATLVPMNLESSAT